MSEKKLVLVDDHVVVRQGLKELIQKLGPYQIAHEYSNGKQLLSDWPLSTQPDLILMDITMPEMDGEETLEKLNESNSQIPILILTLTHDEDRIVRLFRKGVRGYLQKDCDAIEIKKAIEEIFRCGYYHNEFLSYSLRHNEASQKISEQDKILSQLSDRERHFLKLVCDEREYTYDQIAGIMEVQHRTVDGYREAIFEKFDIKSKTGLVLFVLKHKLADLL